MNNGVAGLTTLGSVILIIGHVYYLFEFVFRIHLKHDTIIILIQGPSSTTCFHVVIVINTRCGFARKRILPSHRNISNLPPPNPEQKGRVIMKKKKERKEVVKLGKMKL